MISNNEVLSIAASGFSFSMLFFMMVFIQKINSNKNIIDNRIYMLPWISVIPSVISGILLFEHAKMDYAYIIGVVAVLCILLTAVVYFMLLYYDRKALKSWYSDTSVYNGVQKYYLFVTSFVSAIAVAVILGWVVLLFAGLEL